MIIFFFHARDSFIILFIMMYNLYFDNALNLQSVTNYLTPETHLSHYFNENSFFLINYFLNLIKIN